VETTSRLAKVKKQLREVQEQIADHPLNAPDMLAARAVVKEHRAVERDAIETELARRDLPRLSAQSRALFLGLTSLARLNRKRIRLEQRARDLESSHRAREPDQQSS
jgi:hypothetical protein